MSSTTNVCQKNTQGSKVGRLCICQFWKFEWKRREIESSQKREKNGGKRKIINAASTGNQTQDLSTTNQMSVLTNQVHLKIQFRHRFDQKCPFTDSLHRLGSRFARTSSVQLEIIRFQYRKKSSAKNVVFDNRLIAGSEKIEAPYRIYETRVEVVQQQEARLTMHHLLSRVGGPQQNLLRLFPLGFLTSQVFFFLLHTTQQVFFHFRLFFFLPLSSFSMSSFQKTSYCFHKRHRNSDFKVMIKKGKIFLWVAPKVDFLFVVFQSLQTTTNLCTLQKFFVNSKNPIELFSSSYTVFENHSKLSLRI